jgi:Zn-dependent peptidase ImmA (M78 family)/transcriptional regulator with XRE-family HTH domain
LEALAAEMGGIVTKQALSKCEHDKAQPSPVVLAKLASVLGVKAAYLFHEPTVSVEFIAYRRSPTLRRKEEERVKGIVERALEDRVRLQELSGYCDGSMIPIREWRVNDLEDAEHIAEQLRDRWKLGSDPISNTCATLEDHALVVLTVEANERFDGISAIARDDEQHVKAAVIVTRRDIDGERQRLNLAHELGHIVLDISEDVDEELAAFRFGAAFLAPRERLFDEVGTKRALIQTEELLLLKKQFGISMQALVHRLHDLGIITDSYYKQWWRLFNSYGWRKKEPEELPYEEPHWLRRTALRLLAEGLINQDDAERMLGERIELEQPVSVVQRRAFLKLPLAKRRQILAEQAKRMAKHYDEDTEWRELQGGDVVEY